MDSLTTTTQMSASVNVTDSTGIDAGTAAIVNARVIDISSMAAPVTSATTSRFGDDSIAAFFERPVLINTFTWPSTVASGTQIQNMDPWYLFLTNATVARKTANYYKISGDMCLDVVIQAAPTQYGHAIVQMVPQGVEEYVYPYTIYGDQVVNDVLPTMWQSTQDIYGDLIPATSESLEFNLPWISPQDSIQLSTIGTTGPLGGGFQTQWRFLTHCVVPLSNSTNAASVGSVTIRVFARLKNVKLDIPVTNQGKKGTVGRIAGAVAKAAAVAKSVPFIGEFAAGVEVVSSAVAAVADWFGFTRLSITAPVAWIRNEVIPAMANADGVDGGTTLSLLKDNKVSIDPALFGSDMVDVMSFADIFRRKTLLQLITWTTSNAPGTVLTTIPVTPFFCHNVGSIYYQMPVAYVGSTFHEWRGPMYYEIQVRCSSMHRGMLQIVYQPSTDYTTADPTNTSYNQTFEISAEESIHTFYIGWTQYRMTLPCQQLPFTTTDGSFWNGVFQIRVYAQLSAPDPAASVTVEVYGFSDGNMVFMNPTTLPLIPQSGETDEMDGSMTATVHSLVGSVGDNTGEITSIIHGERIQSIRTLLQRPTYSDSYVSPAQEASNGTLTVETTIWPNVIPNSSTTALPGGANAAITPLEYFSQMFLGWRGTLRHKFVMLVPTQAQVLSATAYTPLKIVVNGYVSHVANAPALSQSTPWFSTDPEILGQNGIVVYDPHLGSVVEVNAPYYKPFRYSVSRVFPKYGAGLTFPAFSDSVSVVNRTFADQGNTYVLNPTWFRYLSAGSDFSMGRFRFVPRVNLT